MPALGDTVHPAEVKKQPYLRVALLSACLLAIGLAVAWLYYPMRAVMDVGGYCAEGGPYVIETHCPEGSTLFLMLGVPLWFAGVFVGLFAAAGRLAAPQPIFAGWALLFGALGWNFMDYGLSADPAGGTVTSWLVCGIVFWLMALPALVILVGGRLIGRRSIDAPAAGLWWLGLYAGLLAAGWWLGSVTLHAWS